MNPKLTQRWRSARGVSLTESAIVLGVIGLVLGGVWVVAADMRNSVRQQKFSELLTSVVDKIRGNYAGKAYFETTTAATMMATLKGMNVFPGETIQAGVTGIVSPFGSDSLYVCGWKASGSSNCSGAAAANVPFFAVEVRVANTSDCVQTSMRNSSTRTQPGLVAVYINGTQQAMPVTLSAVLPATNTVCKAAGTKTIDFVYRLAP